MWAISEDVPLLHMTVPRAYIQCPKWPICQGASGTSGCFQPISLHFTCPSSSVLFHFCKQYKSTLEFLFPYPVLRSLRFLSIDGKCFRVYYPLFSQPTTEYGSAQITCQNIHIKSNIGPFVYSKGRGDISAAARIVFTRGRG